MVIQRFIVIGDLHMQMPNTSSTDTSGIDDRTGPPLKPEGFPDRFALLLRHLRKEKQHGGLDFVICNGDLVHSNSEDPAASLMAIKKEIEQAAGAPLYAGYGNHDRLSDEAWLHVFGHRRNYAFSAGDYGHIILQTSDETGKRQVCPGEAFLQENLNRFADKKGVFVYAHIPRYGGIRPGTKYDAPECKGMMDVLRAAPNLCGVFHSHFHEEDRLFRKQGINILFTGHVAHYGLNYYGCRTVEIRKDGTLTAFQHDMTNEVIRYKDLLR